MLSLAAAAAPALTLAPTPAPTLDSGGAERIVETLSALIKTRDDRAAFTPATVARLAAMS